jgi:hypothetical protein
MLTVSPRRLMPVLVLASLMLTSTSCGHRSTSEPTSTGDVPITARAVAAITAEHLGRPSRAQVDEDPYGLHHPVAATRVRYHAHGDYDGDLVAVLVGTGLDRREDNCPSVQSRGGCFTVDGVRVTWSPAIPEEDPGAIGIVAPRRGGVYVIVVYSGTEITGDPRKRAVSLPLDDLVALASDARIDRTTTQAAVDAGNGLDYWTFG